ncbi:MAG TPA: nitronate monooxygenase [Streptosporangiaceae bacterium]|jgi:NAD(P)H-dependent flavin oxidoreductase YrpB (nitropropane dioxygenase family)
MGREPAGPAGWPVLIQGGMGVAVSGWRLARAVAATGQLGVVSGVALDAVLARRLQLGDPGGDVRCALAELPLPGVAGRILRRYFVPGGIPAGQPFRPVPRLGLRPNPAGTELAVAGNFVEVYLARQDHRGPVGVNYLEKVQLATPAAIYGAMLAGVDYVLMGAGIPAEIPGLLDAFAAGGPGEVSVTVSGADSGARHVARLDPAALHGVSQHGVSQHGAGQHGASGPALSRPVFLAIVSSAILAQYLARHPATAPDGFVLEGPGAGGHSAPPRGRLRLDGSGQPVYGPRDEIDLAKVAALGLPFWLAGGQATAGRLAAARAAGAQGIQVGTAFALCRESGIEAPLRGQLIEQALAGTLAVRNEPAVSPAGFPFKVAGLPGTLGDDAVYDARPRLCDLGYLRVPYQRAGGRVGYRCPAEPIGVYLRKGGTAEDAAGRRCLCNGLLATIGLAQRTGAGTAEPPVVTLGQDLGFLPALVAAAGPGFGAADVVASLLQPAGRPDPR